MEGVNGGSLLSAHTEIAESLQGAPDSPAVISAKLLL